MNINRGSGILARCLAGAVFCGVAAPAAALELGEARMESTMGQPLRVSIRYTAGPNEQIFDSCIRLLGGTTPGIPAVTRARVTLTPEAILVTGQTPVRDPLLDLRIAVNCPYTPTLVRDFMLIVDTAPSEVFEAAPVEIREPAAAPTVVSEPSGTAARPAVTTPRALPATEPVRDNTPAETKTSATEKPARQAGHAPIPAGADYRVVSGDTTSLIASRVEGRTLDMGSAIAALVAANPEAFVDADPNRLASGALLTIPDLSSTDAAMVDTTMADTAIAAPAPAEAPAKPEPVFQAEPAADLNPVEMPEPVAAEPTTESAAAEEPADTVSEPAADAIPETPAVADTPAEPAPVASAPVPETQAIPVEEPVASAPAEARSESPTLRPGDVVRTAPAVVRPAARPASGGIDWVRWGTLGGAGLLVLVVAFFAGRKLMGTFGSTPVGPARQADRPSVDDAVEATPERATAAAVAAPAIESLPAEAPPTAEPVSRSSIVDDVDFEFADTISADAISLDADLDAGTGLKEGSELDVAQDFGFSPGEQAASDFDFEITEAALSEPDAEVTDVNPVLQPAGPREDTDDEYDVSMIVDATRQTIDEDLTEKDLNAIPLEDRVEEFENDQVLQTQVDLEILEQDYQDEYTATLAASKEIEEAAAELALQLSEDEGDAAVTARIPVDPGLEPTAQMPADPGLEPTAMMAAGNEPTRRMPADPGLEPTAQMSVDADLGLTVEMPMDAGLDPTAEMSVSTSDSGVNAELTDSIPIDIDALNDALAAEDITTRIAAAGGDVTVEMPARTKGPGGSN